jgi:hypothetical protein
MRPAEWCLSSHDEWTRWIYRRDVAILDDHRLSCRNFTPSHERRQWHPAVVKLVCNGRTFNPVGRTFDHHIQYGHSGPSGGVARPLTDLAAQSAPLVSSSLNLSAAASDLAGKASEPLRAACYRPSTPPWHGQAKSSIASEQLAPWFSG